MLICSITLTTRATVTVIYPRFMEPEAPSKMLLVTYLRYQSEGGTPRPGQVSAALPLLTLA